MHWVLEFFKNLIQINKSKKSNTQNKSAKDT